MKALGTDERHVEMNVDGASKGGVLKRQQALQGDGWTMDATMEEF